MFVIAARRPPRSPPAPDGPHDVHSPLARGFWRSHAGWILSRRHEAAKLDRVKDRARSPDSYAVLRLLAAAGVVRDIRRRRPDVRRARLGAAPAAPPVPDAR